ncbi:MAG TPA: hypothetical protein DF383_05055, partial [Deltaproteobacteria bacterium]|nr:hypothetical protein [Deltaproteobacteria bacterium]
IQRAVILSAILWIGNVWAAAGISFDGPKITDEQMSDPGDFSVYPFIGDGQVDVAVPAFRNIMGLDNKNNWGSTNPNTYFDVHSNSDDSSNHTAVYGEFNGNNVK